MEWKRRLKDRLLCPIEEGKALSPLTTLGVGGAVECFVEPSRAQDCAEVLRACGEIGFPLHILAGGTNVVFADGRLEGVVLSTLALNASWWSDAGQDVVLDAQAGVLLSLLVRETLREGLGGAEFALGIPGTLGGALSGNAGAGGQSVGALLEEVTTLESDGSFRTWRRGAFDCAYRYFSLTAPGRLIYSCKMRFHRAPRPESERLVARFRQARVRQPHGARSAGCTFKNPPGDSAGRLLDVCGCKGLKVGGAEVSHAHANFVVNSGNATGAEVLELMELCRAVVLEKTGVALEPEIRLKGFQGEAPMVRCQTPVSFGV